MKKSLNINRCHNLIQMQEAESGSVLIIMLIFVSIAILFAVGTLSVTEWNSAVVAARNHTQQTANAGAYTYGKSYIKHVEACISEEITEQLKSVGTPEFEMCRLEGLEECVDNNFEHCDVDLKSCWPDEDESPLKTCPQDSTVRSKAQSDAITAANEMLRHSDLEEKGFQMNGELFTVQTSDKQQTLLPQLGKSGQIDSYASSHIYIKQSP